MEIQLSKKFLRTLRDQAETLAKQCPVPKIVQTISKDPGLLSWLALQHRMGDNGFRRYLSRCIYWSRYDIIYLELLITIYQEFVDGKDTKTFDR